MTPIGARPVFVTTGRDAVADALLGSYNARTVRPSRPDDPSLSIANRLQLDGLSLHYCRYDSAIEIDFPEMAGFRQFFQLSGSGALETRRGALAIDREHTGLIAPQTGFNARYSDGYQHLVLQLDEAAVRAKAEILMGRPCPADLGLPTLQQTPKAAAWRLKLLAVTLAYQFAEPREDDLATQELAQSVTTTFLLHHLGAARLAPAPPEAGAGAIGRLEDYIQARWDQPLTVEAISAACGVSPRSVFACFRRERGVSPMAYAREVRLDNARRLLLGGDGHASVLDVALKCGFASFGHFAHRYRERFGELPSATMARRAR